MVVVCCHFYFFHHFYLLEIFFIWSLIRAAEYFYNLEGLLLGCLQEHLIHPDVKIIFNRKLRNISGEEGGYLIFHKSLHFIILYLVIWSFLYQLQWISLYHHYHIQCHCHCYRMEYNSSTVVLQCNALNVQAWGLCKTRSCLLLCGDYVNYDKDLLLVESVAFSFISIDYTTCSTVQKFVKLQIWAEELWCGIKI